MSSPDQINPESVSTVEGLANLLQEIRILHTDRMSYAKMADSIGKEISRSEMGRILAGDDFPSRAQLHLILDILKIDRFNREAWDAMWSRLAQERYSREKSQEKLPDLPTSVFGHTAHGESENFHKDTISSSASLEEEGGRRAAAIIENAMDEAERIVRSARAAAENEHEALVQSARSAASEIIEKVISEQTRIMRENEKMITGMIDDAEQKLRRVIDELNDSADNTQRTSEELQQLFDHVRASVIEIRTELAQAKEEAETARNKYDTKNSTQKNRDTKKEKPRRLRPLTDRWFSDTRKVPPAVITAENSGYGADHRSGIGADHRSGTETTETDHRSGTETTETDHRSGTETTETDHRSGTETTETDHKPDYGIKDDDNRIKDDDNRIKDDDNEPPWLRDDKYYQ